MANNTLWRNQNRKLKFINVHPQFYAHTLIKTLKKTCLALRDVYQHFLLHSTYRNHDCNQLSGGY